MILVNVTETMGTVRIERPEGEGRRNKGEVEEAGTEASNDFMADTGHRGEGEREGI